jgi:hypothetical protein
MSVLCKYGNHFVCEIFNALTFKHYLNWIKIRFGYRMILSKNPLLMKLKSYFSKCSFLINELTEIAFNEYNIEYFIENDLEAIKSRISFVQKNEPRSENFVVL